MTAEELKMRTKKFAIDIGKLVLTLDKNEINRNYPNQIIRCSSSVAANYRAVRRAKSKPDFINKLKIVEEELDESLLFLELLMEFNESKKQVIETLHTEGEILLRIIVATINSSRN
ncbi:MAG: four helix bundle protein [Chitinophaga sp.]|jgi:four helix bundle protein|nr:four helix bundle protein [Chitinophaga sp.]